MVRNEERLISCTNIAKSSLTDPGTEDHSQTRQQSSVRELSLLKSLAKKKKRKRKSLANREPDYGSKTWLDLVQSDHSTSTKDCSHIWDSWLTMYIYFNTKVLFPCLAKQGVVTASAQGDVVRIKSVQDLLELKAGPGTGSLQWVLAVAWSEWHLVPLSGPPRAFFLSRSFWMALNRVRLTNVWQTLLSVGSFEHQISQLYFFLKKLSLK